MRVVEANDLRIRLVLQTSGHPERDALSERRNYARIRQGEPAQARTLHSDGSVDVMNVVM
jgi:hypothetical protein